MLILASHADGIVNGFLAASLQTFLEHVVIQFIEGNEFAHLFVGIVLCRRVDDLDDASLVTFYLFGYIAEVQEGVEHLHDEFELVRHKRVISHEIVLRLVGHITVWQFELESESSLLLVVEFFQRRHHTFLLIENTLLSDDFRLSAFQRYLHLKAAFNLTFLVFLLCYIAVVEHFGEVLLSGTSHPNLVFTCF